MKIIETEGIILKSQSLAEADKILLVLTREIGMARLSVRGAKRLRNKFGGRLELFTIADLVYSQKEETELGRLFAAETVESFFSLSNKLAVLQILSYFSEVLNLMIPLNEPNQKLYRMVRSSLTAAAHFSDDLPALHLLVSYFEIWLLRLTGFLPDFKVCAKCHFQINSKTVFYSAIENQLVCSNCNFPGDQNKVLDPEFYKLLRMAFVLPPLKFVESVRESEVTRKTVTALTHRLLGRVLDYQPEYWKKEFEFAESIGEPFNNLSSEPPESVASFV